MNGNGCTETARFMKKKKSKRTSTSRIGISVEVKIIDDIGALISSCNPQEINTIMHEPQDLHQLANYIATTLDDLDALQWHEKKIRQHPREVILAIFHHVLKKPDREITTTKRRYYNYRIGLYERTGNYPRD